MCGTPLLTTFTDEYIMCMEGGVSSAEHAKFYTFLLDWTMTRGKQTSIGCRSYT